MKRAKGPAYTSLGQRPRSRAPRNNPKRQRRGSISSERRCAFHIVSANHAASVPKRLSAIAAKAWDRIPRAFWLGSKWNALSALWPRLCEPDLGRCARMVWRRAVGAGAPGPKAREMTAWRNAQRNETGQRPGLYQPGATPQVKGPKKQSQAPTARLNFQRAQMRVPHRLSKPCSVGSKKTIGYCREGMGQNSTSVLAGIEMERAFSALA